MFFGRFRPCFRVLYSTKNYREIINKHKTFKTLHKINRLQLYATMAAGGSFESGGKHKNRLSLEKSPYLLQHATNPVDWYPWGEEAFEKARKEGKLIFLSVGYSTCHWCHVMERESFESEEIAEVLNNNFVSVKVDREERPDVDKMYMAFVQATSGGGGWPMSVWLTPELTPVYGGTYFPPNDRYYGRPGFKTILNTIATKWKENKEKFSESGEKVVQVLQRASSLDAVGPPDRGIIAPGEECWNKLSRDLAMSYDPKFGGFGEAPKFPQPVNLVFLFHLYARDPIAEQGKKALDMCLHTLKMMARGGIHDHISQGFARYSTDERWHVPHFEKMLYDQAQLTVVYASAFLATKDPFYADIVHDILTYVNRDLSHKSGGFYSAEDADSYPFEGAEHKKEGAFCVWTHEDVQKLLANRKVADSTVSLAEIFCQHYNVLPKGNVNPYQDPHDELKMQNVLIVLGSEEETAEAFSLEIGVLREDLSQARAILYEERQKRPRPHLDDKMLTSWNGLMISGFAKAGQALQEGQYIDRAIKAANFVKQHLYNKETGLLLRSCYTGSDGEVAQISSPINGFLDDYAFLIRGLIDLYESCFDVAWLEWAKELQDQQDRLFWDDKGAGYFTSSATDSSILIRLKEDQDGAEPSGNSVACSNLLRLAALLDKPELRERAGRILSAFSTRLTRIPIAVPELTSALLLYHDTPVQVLLAGSLEDVRPLLAEVHTRLLPGRVLALADGNTESLLYRVSETVSHVKQPPAGQAAAYVCRHSACSLPVSTPQDLAKTLTET